MTPRNRARIAVAGLAAIIALYGLASRTPEKLIEAEVRGFVDEFFAARLSRDRSKASTYLSDELRGTLAQLEPTLLIGSSNPHYHAYRIESIEPGGDGAWRIRVMVSEEVSGHGEIGWFYEELAVSRADSGFRVTGLWRGDYHFGTP